jgi:hypothetical protein
MEAVELVVYISLAFLVGILMLQFLMGWNVLDLYDTVKAMIGGEKKVQFQTVDKEGFVSSTYNFWESCGFGEVDKTLAISVSGTGSLSKEYLFNKTRKLNLCDSMPSAQFSCGRVESVIFPLDIPLPRVVRLSCNATSQKLRIEG